MITISLSSLHTYIGYFYSFHNPKGVIYKFSKVKHLFHKLRNINGFVVVRYFHNAGRIKSQVFGVGDIQVRTPHYHKRDNKYIFYWRGKAIARFRRIPKCWPKEFGDMDISRFGLAADAVEERMGNCLPSMLLRGFAINSKILPTNFNIPSYME